MPRTQYPSKSEYRLVRVPRRLRNAPVMLLRRVAGATASPRSRDREASERVLNLFVGHAP
jgi:hypothetical protein